MDAQELLSDSLNLDWSLIPICAPEADGGCTHHSRCDHPGKRPLTSWSRYQKHRPTPNQIRKWSRKWPDANWAVVTGSVSNIAVLDVDDPSSPGGVPITPLSKTGRDGGKHYFFSLPSKFRKSQQISNGLEYKADGSYVVLPNSYHQTGNHYSWVISPFETNLADITHCPDEWLARALHEKPAKREVTELVNGVQKGLRNISATQMAGKFLGWAPVGDWEDFVWPMLVSWNESNRPPLAHSELKTVFQKIAQRELSKRLRVARASLSDEKSQRLFDRIQETIAQNPKMNRRQIYRKLSGHRYDHFQDLLELALQHSPEAQRLDDSFNGKAWGLQHASAQDQGRIKSVENDGFGDIAGADNADTH